MALDPRADFRDDGGTPMWRARRTIDVQRPGIRAAWKRLSLIQQAMMVLFFGFAMPFIIIFGGLAVLAIWDALTRHL